MEIDEEINGCNGIKGGKPLTLDWDNLFVSGDNDLPPEIIVKSSKKPVDVSGGSTETDTLENREQDTELMMKTDGEINEFIWRQKRMEKISYKLPDRGEKLKATVRRYEAELERRNQAKLTKVENGSKETIQLSDHSDDGGSCGNKKGGQNSASASRFTKRFLSKLMEHNSKWLHPDPVVIDTRNKRREPIVEKVVGNNSVDLNQDDEANPSNSNPNQDMYGRDRKARPPGKPRKSRKKSSDSTPSRSSRELLHLSMKENHDTVAERKRRYYESKQVEVEMRTLAIDMTEEDKKVIEMQKALIRRNVLKRFEEVQELSTDTDE